MRMHILPPDLLGMAIVSSMAGVASAPLDYELPEETATFRVGEGREIPQNNCLTCHSVRNPP